MSAGSAARRPLLGDRRARAAAAVLVLVVALNALALALGGLLREPGGEPWSSYATGPEGLAAYAGLLARDGRRVGAARAGPAQRAPDPRTTLVLAEPDPVSAVDARALRRFLERGGRLVAADTRPEGWLRVLLARAPRWSAARTGATVLAPIPELAGVEDVRATSGSWSTTGAALPALGGERGALLAVAAVGAGRLVLLADPSPLSNRRLALEDHAALGLGLAGEARRPVLFAEWAHGAQATGLAALPARWRLALLGLGLAGFVFIASRARRFGPPEPEARPLGPPRALYAHALGAALARTRRPGEAAEPVREEARRLLGRRAGRGREHDPDALRAAARRAGLGPEEAEAVLGDVRDERGALAAGRALAHLSRAAG